MVVVNTLINMVTHTQLVTFKFNVLVTYQSYIQTLLLLYDLDSIVVQAVGNLQQAITHPWYYTCICVTLNLLVGVIHWGKNLSVYTQMIVL